MMETLDSWSEEQALTRARRFVPEPDIRTVSVDLETCAVMLSDWDMM